MESIIGTSTLPSLAVGQVERRQTAWRRGFSEGMRRSVLSIAVSLIGIVCNPAEAGDCFTQAAAYQGVNEGILRAIAIKETSSCRSIITTNTNRSTDHGCMGINSIHFEELAKYGVLPQHLMNKCVNVYVGAWHLKRRLIEFGNTWTGVGTYHSKTPSKRDKYAREVYEIWIRNGLNRY